MVQTDHLFVVAAVQPGGASKTNRTGMAQQERSGMVRSDQPNK